MNKLSLLCAFIPVMGLSAKNQLECCEKSLNWRSVNHDICNTRSIKETKISATNVGSLVLKWNVPGNSVNTAAIVDGNVVYYGDSLGNVFARDVTNGAQIWATNVAATVIESPLLVSDEYVYVAPDNLNLYALHKANGTIAWQQVVDPVMQATGQGSVLAGPTLIDDLVIVNTTLSTFGELTANPPTARGGVQAFCAKTGAFVWRYIVSPAPGGTGINSWSTPAYDKERHLMFFGTSQATTPPAGELSDAIIALDYRTGKFKWSFQTTKCDVYSTLYTGDSDPTKDRDVGASPNLFTIYKKSKKGHNKKKDVVGVNPKNGIYYVLDREKGKLIWKTTLTPKTTTIFGNSGAAFANNTIYSIATYDPAFIVTPELLWKAGNGDPTSVGIALGALSAEMITRVQALNPCNGSVQWFNDHVGATFGSVTEANGVLYTGNFNGLWQAIDAASGVQLAQFNIPQMLFPNNLAIESPITVVDGRVFVTAGSVINPAAGGIFVYSF